ncbi:MAG: LysM peptidoglycan-binding domain-containing protein [Richelia sp. RM2_1_2]|nr:LysM peptidoglycan-binding domain-containing protein [Richelia sp. RM2_1_2]
MFCFALVLMLSGCLFDKKVDQKSDSQIISDVLSQPNVSVDDRGQISFTIEKQHGNMHVEKVTYTISGLKTCKESITPITTQPSTTQPVPTSRPTLDVKYGVSVNGQKLPDGWGVYQVKDGDTLTNIADRANVSTKDITDINTEIKDDSSLKEGVLIVIPSAK